MKTFEKHWNGIDDLDLYIEVKIMPIYPDKCPSLQLTKDLVTKMDEDDDYIKANEIRRRHHIVTREMRRTMAKDSKANRTVTKAKAKANAVLKGKLSYTRQNRHEAKALCREYM